MLGIREISAASYSSCCVPSQRRAALSRASDLVCVTFTRMQYVAQERSWHSRRRHGRETISGLNNLS